MREIEGAEHLESFEVVQAALAQEVLHLLQCQRCARLVLEYAAAREVTPFEQMSREE